MTTKLHLVLLISIVMAAFACGDATTEELVSSTLQTDMTDDRADSPGNWKVKTDGMTMWVDTVLEPVVQAKQTSWIMRGRVSKTLTGFRAYTDDGHHFAAELTSDRKFQVVLNQHEALDVIGGKRVYFDFFAKAGVHPMYHGMVNFAARFGSYAGSSAVFVYRAVNPIIVAGELRFRGRASTRSGFALDLVYTDDDANPALHADEPNQYHFDWSPEALHLAADPPEDPVWFRGSDTATTPVEKTASIELRLVRMGLGTDHPFDAWPPDRCEPEVKTCLQALELADTESCGWANQVRPCLDRVELRGGADATRFAADLKTAITSWYDTHAADVRARHGRTLEAALDRIDVDRVGRVDDGEVHLLGYDPAYFEAFFHPDPVFEDSARVWYGIYDRGGSLVHIEAVN